ncbi:MAG TPA: discoidin domain-containing protein [Candidatus Limousia pullorum]|uniref:Discoidin domain-containing protein n=1 Tax=Candidatus Limousia pullorum TaxID=2840860 RepID=A0A9D1S7X0_9FIRM|nr:discoidin domain-containing protein [Candidatus Limousia pullorum]
MKGNLLKKVISCVLGATMVTSMFVTGFSFASAEVGYINLDRTNFKITVPSAYGSNPSTYMLDGNKSTIWETDWSQGSTQLPAEILVDMGEVKENVSRVIYTPRQTDVNGKIKDYKVYAGETTDDMQLVSEGSWDWGSTNTEIAAKIDDAYADFDIPVNARYIKILVESATTKPPDPNQTITCAELNIAVKGEVEPPVPDEKIPQNEMSVEYVVSQYGGSPAKNMLDGNKSTWWESDWSSSATYFEPGDYFIIDLGKVREDLSQIIFTPRQDNQNGHIYEFEIYTSAVEGDLTDTDIDNEANGFTFAGKGEWGSGTDDCTATFASRDARYVAVKVFSVGGDGNTITCGEFNAKTEANVTVDVSALEGAIAVAQQAIADTTNEIAKEKIQAALDAVGDVNLYVQEGVQAAADALLETVETYATIGNVTTVKPGKVWVDNNGNAIQAHGGGILYDEKTKTYYWYGEHKGYENVPTGAETGNPGIGIGCYSSKDLLNWTYEGVALPVFNNPQLVDGTTTDDNVPMYVSEESDTYKNSPLPEFEGTASNHNGLMKSPYSSLSALNSDEYIDELNARYENDNLTFEEKQQMYREFNWNRVVERPKVIYNDKTGKYVMWWHQDGPRMGLYSVASAGIAISDSPTGPFKYLCTRRVTMTGVLTTGNGDGMLRDMTLFKDDDGTAYVVYSSEENATTIIHKLNDGYTGLSGDL